MAAHVRTWGFQLSVIDVLALIAAPACAWGVLDAIGPVAWALPIALAHFFLFCNVFRIHRTKELCWAAIFVVHVTVWVAIDRLSWPLVVALQAPVTIGLILLEMRGPGYHGIIARRINPHLDRYLAGDMP